MKYCDDIIPISNQPAHSWVIAKTHRFDTIEDINVTDLKFRPIIDQTGIERSCRVFKTTCCECIYNSW